MSNESVEIKYESGSISYSDLKNKVTVPEYQRDIVWTDKAKSDFIDALAKGFPFGSLLLYQVNGSDVNVKDKNNEYSIIDGLQRYSTMREFEDDPGSFWQGNSSEKMLKEFLRVFQEYNKQVGESWTSKSEEDVKTWYAGLVKNNKRANVNIKSYKGFLPTKVGVSQDDRDDAVAKIQDLITALDNKINSFIDLNTLKIPVIYFLGSSDELADVFSGLNKSGTRLSKYQVFTAAWSHEKFKLDNNDDTNKIISSIIDRFERMKSDRGNIKITNFNIREFKEARLINLAQFAYGLGKLIVENSPALLQGTEGDDLYNEVGFGTLGIITGTPSNKLSHIIEKIDDISKNHVQIINEVLSIVNEINAEFDPLTKKRIKYLNSENRKEFETGLSSKLKFLSYIASIWKIKHRKNDESRLTKDAEITNTIKNLPIYYVIDFLRRTWSGSGDSRLNSYYTTGAEPRSYTKKPSEDQIMAAFNSYAENEDPSIRFTAKTKALTTIFANLSYPKCFQPANSYDFEHIIAASYLKDEYQDHGIKGAGIGNAVLLDTELNKIKQTKDLYETASYKIKPGQNRGRKLDTIRIATKKAKELVSDSGRLDEMMYPSEMELEEAYKQMGQGDFTVVKKIIDDRTRKVCNRFVKLLFEM
ncbi:DUF262 domain-containing protein [Levilactobacillus hammesii]|uniref:GmrSD restriction endonucleases N-terminal domain-containing protein n=1 Tax=Levilactobacillus hammesii DSM 16381 TaxID=1423753 RepID=A0A0R1UPQ9_9LACO|nr:DUF262 domain-containing protein [Levilactobacillus hammesii]KRL93368.1 hypothetical protein FD28_GL001244 [Levilactobacillus hammesii DSM 16381]